GWSADGRRRSPLCRSPAIAVGGRRQFDHRDPPVAPPALDAAVLAADLGVDLAVNELVFQPDRRLRLSYTP
ncbi:MAG: hypothetical protein R6V12_07955, partial [Candidatus Hydrogenedentota bacterium]